MQLCNLPGEHYKRAFIKRRLNGFRNTCEYSNRSGLRKLVQRLSTMVDCGTYSFDQFWTEKSLTNTNLPATMIKLDLMRKKEQIYIYEVARHGDMVKGFIIKGTGVRSVQIDVAGTIIWKMKTYGRNCIWIQPFCTGIPLILLQFFYVRIHIDADAVDQCTCKYLYLDVPDRHRILHEKIEIHYISPANLPITKTGAQLYGNYKLIWAAWPVFGYVGPTEYLA